MHKIPTAAFALLLSLGLAACSDRADAPKPAASVQQTPLPADAGQVGQIQTQIARLNPEEQRLFMAYLRRYTPVSNVFSNVSSASQPAPLPAGATIGSALEEQRKFEAAAAAPAK